MRDQLGQRRLSEHWHAFWWLVIVAVATAAYVGGHLLLRDCYIKDIRPEVKDAVQMYGVRSHNRTGVLQLHVGATVYEPDSEAPGPLAIGNLPQARGVLNHAFAVVEEYNSSVRAYVEGLRSGFFRSPHNPYLMAVIVRPSELPPKPSPPEEGKPPDEGICKPKNGGEVQYRFRVSADNFVRILEQYPNEETLEAFIDLMDDAEPVCVIAGEGVKPWSSGAGTLAQSIFEMCKRRQDLRAGVTGLFGPIGFSRVVGCDSTPWACGPCQRAEQYLRAKSNGSSNFKPPNAPKETKFHKELRDVVQRNAGFFWTSGKYFWIEIMLLAVLGVLIRQLVAFARAYTGGRNSRRVWRPKESLRTLMYVAVAPIFSLVVIWILSATNLVTVKPVIGEVWSNVTVPIAFLLGLFPTLGYDVLSGLAKGLFGRSFKSDERDKADPKKIPDMPGGMATDDGPSIKRLRQRIRHHATAVFR